MNIRLKLTIQFSVIVSILLMVFSFSLYISFSAYRKHEMYKKNLDKANSTAKLLLQVKEINHNILHLINANTINAPYSVYIYNENRNLLYNSDGFSAKLDNPIVYLDEIDKKGAINSHYLQYELAGTKIQFKNKNYYLIGFSFDKYGFDKLRFLGNVILISFFIGTFITFIAAYFFAGQALVPISKVNDEVNKIDANNIFLRVYEGNVNDEITILAKTFNGMLDRLEKSIKNQQTFFSNASSELRNPLIQINKQIEDALSKERNTDEYIKILNSILVNVKNVIELSNGLLELATVGFEYTATRLTELNIDDIIWQARTEVLALNDEYKVFIKFGDIDDDDGGLTIKGNEHLLFVAFSHLIENACKYSIDKQAEITISSSKSKVEIIVYDNGIGIAQEEIKRVFEPFYRAKNSENNYGHGLGLTLAERIILLHKGNIEIYSEVNTGTHIHVFLNKINYEQS